MLFMKFRVLCLEHHSQQNSKALHCLAGFRHDVVSFFLSRDHCTLSVVLTHRKYTTSGSLSVARLCFFCGGGGAFQLCSFSVSTALLEVQKRDSVSSATMKSYFQTDAENYAGNLKPHPFGRQPAGYVLQRITLSLTSSPAL